MITFRCSPQSVPENFEAKSHSHPKAKRIARKIWTILRSEISKRDNELEHRPLGEIPLDRRNIKNNPKQTQNEKTTRTRLIQPMFHFLMTSKNYFR
ncbi:hypothetical protein DQM68_07395 [Leptospira mayottensis]|uniref:Uncharacterized protein n=1 Tax=Leptospira mayottensis TaxID=1137606 RepID=A0ABN5NQV9_9LEPT|nr:hypothetical protein DQM68_07395 [Leptospira mayottensis]AXR64343.1 hypothetical protein DQM28_09075 [Leptospira mayottensis]AZQ03033.1 hypothetical protein LEP1GSC190_14290 [Leptospira mayottensis 200901116]